MRKLQPHEIKTLAHVRHHRRVCLGEITCEADALLAETMKILAKRKLLLEEETDDGPAYSCMAPALLILEQFYG